MSKIKSINPTVNIINLRIVVKQKNPTYLCQLIHKSIHNEYKVRLLCNQQKLSILEIDRINNDGMIAQPTTVSAITPFILNNVNPTCIHIIKNIITGKYLTLNSPSL